MDKGKKLKNYSDKNYAEIITFPVELVGRDGVVRRYSYEDSMRIYRRRIDSAHLRYQDRDIIRAEVYHCTRRMEQIQRSWHQRIHRSEQSYIERRPDPAERAPYEQGKAFLQSWMGGILSALGAGTEPGPNLVLLTEISPCRVFYVNHPGFRPNTLLYAFDLAWRDPSGELDGRRAFQDYADLLHRGGPAPDVEKLIHQEVAGEYGFILTNPHADILSEDIAALPAGRDPGRAPVGITDRSSFLAWLDTLVQEAAVPEDSPLRPILEVMATGELEAAFILCIDAVEGSPYNQRAYWIMGALSEILGRWEVAEPYMLMACHYFPHDPQAQLLAGLHRLRMGAPRAALPHLLNARDWNPELPCLHAQLVRAYAATRDLGRAHGMLEEGRRLHPGDPELQVLEVTFRHLRERYLQILAAATAVVVVGMVVSVSWPGLALPAALVSCVTVIALGVAWWRRERSWFEVLD